MNPLNSVTKFSSHRYEQVPEEKPASTAHNRRRPSQADTPLATLSPPPSRVRPAEQVPKAPSSTPESVTKAAVAAKERRKTKKVMVGAIGIARPRVIYVAKTTADPFNTAFHEDINLPDLPKEEYLRPPTAYTHFPE
ncbi:hypothetical protein [Paraburkholderia sp. CI3]|uniref:hypothetical protein n=1 Tax=Paraburkholderia sp. CI3 TaxID=2991060 RepID=UPI003D221D19